MPNFRFHIREHSQICSQHFQPNDFHLVGEGKTCLSSGAVPTVFFDLENYQPPKQYYNPYGNDGVDDDGDDCDINKDKIAESRSIELIQVNYC